MKQGKGFTLIELMIVVAIIAILASIAIPQYQDYIAKTQLQRLVAEVANKKTSVEEFILNGWYDFNENDIGWTNSNIAALTDGATPTAGDGLQIISFSILRNGYGYLQSVVGGDAGANISGVQVFIEREQNSTWSCQIEKSATFSWKNSYLPSGCELLADGAAPTDD